MSIRRLPIAALLLSVAATAPLAAQASDSVVFRGAPTSNISSSVVVPAGRTMFYISGLLAPVADSSAAQGTRERYGDTKTQGVNTIKAIEKQLQLVGLGLKDVITMHVFLGPDATKGGAFDFAGWNEAYNQFFNTPSNPVKVTRYTVGVAALARPDGLIEIEATAVFPKK